MGEETLAIKALLDEKTLKILQIFVNNDKSDYYLRELAGKADVPPATTFRIINKLLDLKIIELTKIKKLKIYKLANNTSAEFLKKILTEELDIGQIFKDKIKDLSGLQLAVMHGKVSKNKTNILIIGEDIDKDELKVITDEIKQLHDFNISALTLTQDQYEQMTSMGLYSGEKKILYKQV